MRLRKAIAVAGIAALALLGTACGRDDKPGGTPPPTGAPPAAPSLPVYTAKAGVDLSASPTWAKAKERGHLIVGAKDDQPFLGYLDRATLARSGFDIEIARMVSAELGLDPAKIEFSTVPSSGRETAIQNGDVDMYVGTYSITEQRKKLVAFAGPYYVSGQSFLVRKDEQAITGKDTIRGKRVCSAKGSTAFQRLQVDFPETQAVFQDDYSNCVEHLLAGQVDAVSTDEAILKGYAAKDPGRLKVVGQPFTTENYGIGLPQQDPVFRTAVNDAIEASIANGNWKAAYDATLGLSGAPAPQTPKVERG
ncbi:glutamate ABC transporter substrate-binding protein [Yinghuangia soli]|uniref:Glutamate ABC transporter substrate-binding protein n=1 Tax=Yinghuangia soli TaxID=2908204 RepID=A0AA41Q9Y3_9ACTN|nr:glutamate ABC transporter substrate-binding protein [Yinghuangia soli]MCF2533079.1 glutamate ABC transporter substrate-binding protein [Yinghuangia soli]